MMAGEGAEPRVEPSGEALRAVLGGEIGGEVADEAVEIAAGEERRRLAHEDRARAEGLDDEPEGGEFLRMGRKERRGAGIEVDDHGMEQDLALDPAPLPVALQGLVDDPLVGRVLVDEDEAVRRLGDDIGLVELGARRPERRRERRGLGLEVGRRASPGLELGGEASLGGLGEMTRLA